MNGRTNYTERFRRLAATLILGAILVIPSAAQEPDNPEAVLDQVEEAYELGDPVERLEAYDALAQEILLDAGRRLPEREPTGAAGSSSMDRWIVNVETDPLSDETVLFFAIPATSGRSAYGDAPVLALRRSGSVESVYIIWEDYLADDTQTVQYRIDDGETQRRQWNVSTDNTATFYTGDVMELIRRLVDADRFVARTTPYSESPVTAVFDLAGLSELLEEHSEYVGDWAE